MKKAVEAVLEGKMGYMLAAKSFSVPQTTLERKVKKSRENSNDIQNLKIPLGPKLPVFSQEEENELVDYLLDMESRVSVTKFFNFLANVYDENKLTLDRIYNCDETGISVVPKTRSKIIVRKEQKQVGAIVSAERGTIVTVEICFNAAGRYLTPC
ncbi:unnamed protein product [Euphydryas editha]|uniref:HTH psq-type domain-containing protein n=1 Tax=Euphydryas editha TaxID=104508 RepID=A0AAU9TVW3_EUPED|nr:unnamed protein product [Euphydryas editha]